MIILDGAMGTMLMAQGHDPTREPLVNLNITAADVVVKIHCDYIAAGADALFTHSFGANSLNLRSFGLEKSCKEINQRAVANTRKASKKTTLVFASLAMPPVQAQNEQRLSSLAQQLKFLTDEGVDGVVIETITTLNDADLAAQALNMATNKEITRVVSLSPHDDAMLADGTPLTIVILQLKAAGIDCIGLNCLSGPLAAVKLAAEIGEITKILLKPNAGLPITSDGLLVYPAQPKEFAATLAPAFAFATMIGGCCGTTPGHINQLAKHLKNVR